MVDARYVGVAVRSDRKTAKQRRRAGKAECKVCAGSQYLVPDRWHILHLTNISPDVTSRELLEIYALRCDIETQFKACKKLLNLGKGFKGVSKQDHSESLILAL